MSRLKHVTSPTEFLDKLAIPRRNLRIAQLAIDGLASREIGEVFPEELSDLGALLDEAVAEIERNVGEFTSLVGAR